MLPDFTVCHFHKRTFGDGVVKVQPTQGHFKDAILNDLASDSNIAQFVSFDPELRQRFAWVHGFSPNHAFATPEDALQALIRAAPESSVNIRSFEPGNPKSREFLYGLTRVSQAIEHLRRLSETGLYTIVNETVNVQDGGVSGVAFGEAVEFAPGDTPRAVEKPGTAALPRRLALKLLKTVYHFDPELPADKRLRVEFSIHPLRRGYRHNHTIIWETERIGVAPSTVDVVWPNRFSRSIGDKVYGLLIAHLMGLRVPRSVVIAREVSTFEFGTPTGSAERWIRTAPREQVPGRFTTRKGWVDPFALLSAEDPSGAIAAIISQHSVEAKYAGAAMAQADGLVMVEGIKGEGDAFMVGSRAPEVLPVAVQEQVMRVYSAAAKQLGPVRFEWVFDGEHVWIVQFHRGGSPSIGRVIYPGDAHQYQEFPIENGLEALRTLVQQVQGTGQGIVLLGHVGVTSHFGDVLRRARIPSRIEEPIPVTQAL